MSLQVFIKREGDKISLIVDGIGAQSKRIPGGERTRLTGPLYVGGVPQSLTVKHPDSSVCRTHTVFNKHLHQTVVLHVCIDSF